MPKRKGSAKVATAGVTRTKLYVEEELGWLFREQPTEDFGIDAHVEVVDGEDVRGRLLALQIKSGKSWFKEPAHDDGWWHRPDEDHVQYWLNHSLPVVIVMYDPRTRLCHWQLANRSALQRSSKGGWKLLIPKSQVLDSSAVDPWQRAADGDPYELRMRQLRLARPWMDMLASGSRLVLEFEEWINKSSGRGSMAIGVDNDDGRDPEILAAWHFFPGPLNYAESVPTFFAWADVSLHEETYDEADWELYDTETRIWGEDDFHSETFADWKAGLRPGLRPYSNASGEVDLYRLELTLNALGKAFLTVDNFANTGQRQLTE